MMLVRGGLVAAALAAEGAVRAPRAPPTLLAAARPRRTPARAWGGLNGLRRRPGSLRGRQARRTKAVLRRRSSGALTCANAANGAGLVVGD